MVIGPAAPALPASFVGTSDAAAPPASFDAAALPPVPAWLMTVESPAVPAQPNNVALPVLPDVPLSPPSELLVITGPVTPVAVAEPPRLTLLGLATVPPRLKAPSEALAARPAAPARPPDTTLTMLAVDSSSGSTQAATKIPVNANARLKERALNSVMGRRLWGSSRSWFRTPLRRRDVVVTRDQFYSAPPECGRDVWPIVGTSDCPAPKQDFSPSSARAHLPSHHLAQGGTQDFPFSRSPGLGWHGRHGSYLRDRGYPR
jgi:hypothetical protein